MEDIVAVFGLAVYAKVQMVWLKQDEFDGLVIRLGEFHLTMSYMGVIGKRF